MRTPDADFNIYYVVGICGKSSAKMRQVLCYILKPDLSTFHHPNFPIVEVGGRRAEKVALILLELPVIPPIAAGRVRLHDE